MLNGELRWFFPWTLVLPKNPMLWFVVGNWVIMKVYWIAYVCTDIDDWNYVIAHA